LAEGLCDETEQAKCLEEFGDNLAWACENCDKKKFGGLAPYTMKLLRINHLQQAGYPLRANDLTLEEWYDLGDLKKALPDGMADLPALLISMMTMGR